MAPLFAPRRLAQHAHLALWVAALVVGGALSGCKPQPPTPKAQASSASAPEDAAHVAAPPAAPPQSLKDLLELAGSYPGERTDYLREGALAQRLRTLMGADYEVLLANLGTSGPLVRAGNQLLITGNKPHDGGNEQAAVLVDPQQNTVQVWLVHEGLEREVHDPGFVLQPWPQDVLTMQANWRAIKPQPGENKAGA